MDCKVWFVYLFLLLTGWIVFVLGESPRYMILAPNMFHVGVEERVSVSISGVSSPIKVQLFLQDYPAKKTNFSHTEGIFQSGEPRFLYINIKHKDVPDHDMETSQYLYLVAMSNDSQLLFRKEVKILLNYKDKIVFVQTDKPIYTPLQTVNIRIMPLDFELKPSKDNVSILIKNPQDVIVQRWQYLTTETGFITKALYLGDHAMLGNWTVIANYGYLRSQNTTVKFEVKEYVLPKFSVRINGPSYILPSTKTINIDLVAKYTYGKAVKADAILRMTVTGKGFMDVKIYANTKQLKDGKIRFEVDSSFIKKNALLPSFPTGRRLRIEADVVEKATGVTEKVVDNTIYFVNTPYHLSYENTALYFKPSIPYSIKIDVKYPNKNPASDINIHIRAIGKSKSGKDINVMGKVNHNNRAFLQDKTNGEGQVEVSFDVPRQVTSIKIEVETKDRRIPDKENAAIEFTAKAYSSRSGSYLHIRPRKTSKVIVGMTSTWDVFQNRNITELNFMVISRGRIVAQATSRPRHGVNIISTMAFSISMEMSPRCRVLAYYVTRDNEVVSDSAVLDVEPILPNKARLVHNQGRGKHEYPGAGYNIEIETTPMSRVALLGVDESIYLLRKKGKLTSKKVFKEVSELEGGCEAGSGIDNNDVFEKSGMMVISNVNIHTREKGKTCLAKQNSRRRKKRAVLTQEEQTCCDNGKFFSRASCAVRARFMVKATLKCREAFLNCCRITWNEKAPEVVVRQRQFQTRNGFSAEEDSDGDSIQIRKYFPETWIFDELTAGPDGRVVLPVTLPDTITTWIVQAISISNQTGFGLALPSRITTFKNFFVSLTLPYSVQRGEQLSVIATVFNYGIIEHMYEVKLKGDDGFCSEAVPGVSSKPIQFLLKGNDVKSVTIPIVPVQLGKVQIRVSATQLKTSYFPSQTDVVYRDLLVVPEGAERRLVHSLVLDPQGVLRDERRNDNVNNNSSTTPSPTLKSERAVQAGHQIDTIMLEVPSKAIPGSIRSTLYLTGNLIGPVVTNLIKGGLGDILRMPLGCGEQNMIYLAPNVYVLEYLTNTRQVTSDVEARAYRFIQQGYQQELGFRRKDKSFSAFGETRPGSIWLTAFVIKVFNAATRFEGIAIDLKMMCESVEWLLSNQRADGAFPEVHDLIHKSLLGGVHGDVAMTAFVMTALLESRCNVQNTKTSIDKAVNYLEQEVSSLTKAHILALTAYSLALAKSSHGTKANNKLMLLSTYHKGKNTRHWDVGGNALNVETAGYALLAQLHLGRLKHGGPIVKWLTEQRNSGGGFISTQDTCVALQALSKYSEKTVGADLDLSVSLLPEKDGAWKRTFHVDKTNALIQKTVDITPFLGGELIIDSLGSGVGQMQIEIAYNVPTSKNETCLFDVNVEVKEIFNKDGADDKLMLGGSANRQKRDLRARPKKRRRKCRGKNKKRCRKDRRKKAKQQKRKKNGKDKSKKRKKNKKDKRQKTQGRAPDSLLLKICTRYRKPGKSGMTIIDIGIFTGFEADKKSLVELKKNVRPTVDRFEFSDRSIVLYVSEVSNAKEFCAAFKVNRIFGVGAVQPVPIKVYDYYEPEDACTKFYSPDSKSELLLGICKGDQCKCTQDGCTPCNIQFPTIEDMLEESCQRHEFVIQGKVLLVDEDDNNRKSWLTYFVEIQQIFKQKNGKAKMAVTDVIEYKKRSECKCPELIENKEYLIMGQKQGLQLVLDKNTVVMPWQGRTVQDNNMLGLFRARMNQNQPCPH